MPWFLIEGDFEPKASAAFGRFVTLPSGEMIPILPSGRVHEIVALESAEGVTAPLTARPIGGLERCWRMVWRVWLTWRRLSPERRRRSGLRLWRLVWGLPQAYRIASRFRGMTYAQWIEEAEPGIHAHQIGKWGPDPLRRPRIHVVQLGEGATAPVMEAEDWVMLLAPTDRLASKALDWFAAEAGCHPEAAIIYADDDELDARRRRVNPRFKPDWSYLHLQGIDYIGRAAIISARALTAAGRIRPQNLAGDTWELLLRVGEIAGDAIRHIPAILLHRDAQAEGAKPSVRRVRFGLPGPPPQVSIIIPTRDKADYLRRCVESVLHKTRYPRFDLLVVDNGSREPDALAYLQELAGRPRVRVQQYDRPFNFSAINNYAARQATGEVLCFLNNDTEVITPDWLDEMVGQLVQPRVAVVGAKLLYADGRVQHGGDTVGPGGCADHLHEGIDRDNPGYCYRAAVAQDLSAVTAACMLTWQKTFLELDGFNARWLPVAFNDVDYCLRVRAAGLRVVYTPHAELYHHESASRGRLRGWRHELRAWREVTYMRWKWREVMWHDPYYNPNFTYQRPDFVLGP